MDLYGIGRIEFSWDFDEESYKEWLDDSELEDNHESLMEYIKDYVTFDVETFDNDTFHHVSFESIDYDELIETVGEKISIRAVNDILENGSFGIETSEIHNTTEEFDVNNPEELDAVAMKMFNHGEYYKNARGYILSNGEVIYTVR